MDFLRRVFTKKSFKIAVRKAKFNFSV